MTKPGEQAAKVAKLVADRTKVPLPKVAQIFQKYPLNKAGLDKAIKEVETLAAEIMKKDLTTMFPFFK